MKKYQTLKTQLSPAELAATLVEELGILRQYKQEGTIEAQTRGENVRELLLAIAEFAASAGGEATLERYLENVSLVMDIDIWNDRANAVTLMTLHSAKGLEFPIVFVTGLEEGLFPISRSLNDNPALEEERRLFYVGATRARTNLYLSWARNRRRYGEKTFGSMSRFIAEIDSRLIKVESTYRQKPMTRTPRQPAYDEQRMPRYEDESQEPVEFHLGMRVAHPTFGKGTIMNIEPSRTTLKMRVLFDDGSEKRLVLPYAKLEIL